MKIIICLMLCIFILNQLICSVNGAGVAVMSVDLGNEFIKIGIVSPGKPMETVLNTDSSRKSPMAVAFRDGQRFFGEAALTVAIRFPEKVYTRLLDLIGKPIDHPIVQNYIQQFPYHNITSNEKGDGLLLTHPEGDVFTPEELLAMILERTRIYSEHFLSNDMIVKSAVIVVPSYLNQAERLAILNSGKIAGLNVLQLLNVNTAVALNYGLFRINDFSIDKPKNIIFYNMGSASTQVSVASFQLRKKTDTAYPSTTPELIVRGVGYDRTLGGFEMQRRLRDYLAKLFVDQHASKDKRITMSKVKENKRAMSKLLKEAGRVKTMLSANNEIQARVENVMHDLDLKMTVNRNDYEDICLDLLTSRVVKPLEDALHMSGLTTQEIEQVVLFGGNTRTPRVQKSLLEFLSGLELSKNVNSDEAASLGGAYLAAGLSKGFRVKSFDIRELNLFPIVIEFDRINASENNKNKKNQRVLFAKGNSYPIRKVITFNKNTNDFDFDVKYGDLSFLSAVEEVNVGSKALINAKTSSLNKVIELYNDNDKFEHKGIKAHFHMDPNGILLLEKVDYVVNERVEVPVENKDNSDNESNIVRDTLSNLGETVSNLFGHKTSNDTEAEVEEAKPNANDDKTADHSKDEQLNKDVQNLKKEIKLKPIKVPVDMNVNILYGTSKEDEIAQNIDNLQKYSDKERRLLEQEQIKNTFESFLIETKSKLYENEYEQASTEKEREQYLNKLNEASEWLEYESDSADTSTFQDKLKAITQEFFGLFERVQEHRIRPQALESLNDFLNKTDDFLKAIQNLKEDQVFTEVEISSLQKLVEETKQWRDEKINDQNQTPLHETPKLLSKDIQEKISNLDRELKYLYHKQQLAVQKKRAEKLAEKQKQEAEKKANDKKDNSKSSEQTSNENEDQQQESKSESDQTNDQQLPSENEPLPMDEIPIKATNVDIEGSHTEL